MYVPTADTLIGKRAGGVQQVGVVEQIEAKAHVEAPVGVIERQPAFGAKLLVVILRGTGSPDLFIGDKEIAVGLEVAGKAGRIVLCGQLSRANTAQEKDVVQVFHLALNALVLPARIALKAHIGLGVCNKGRE